LILFKKWCCQFALSHQFAYAIAHHDRMLTILHSAFWSTRYQNRLLVSTDRFIGYQVETIRMISKILVPHDGTEIDRALEKAIKLGKAFKAELVLLHVLIEQIPVPPTIMLGGDTVLINRSRRSIRKELEQGWNNIAEVKIHEMGKEKVKATCGCSIGSAGEQILQFAKDNKIDIIVMGSRRLKGVSKIKALGSIARKGSEIAECPVLIVP
jgi:nucleotide-binding universal stress UspA family protein